MVEGDFNAIETERGRVSLESYLSGRESQAAPVIDRLIAAGRLDVLTPEDRKTLYQFAALQMLRGTGHRAAFLAASESVDARFKEMGLELAEEIIPTTLEVKLSGLASIAKDLPTYEAHIATKDLVLFRAPRGSEFILGDNPVALNNRPSTGFWGNLGLACEGIEIYLPISSHFSLGFWCPSHREKITAASSETRRTIGNLRAQATLSGRPLPQKMSAFLEQGDDTLARMAPVLAALELGHALDITRENVIHFNSLQVAHAERYLVSRDGDFSLPHEMISEHASYRTGRRFKIS